MTTTHHKRPTNNRPNKSHRLLLWFYLAALASILPAFTSAQADNWTDGNGNWNTPTNWNGGIPASNASVNIVNSDGNSRTINYDYTGPAVALYALNLSLTGGNGASSETLSMSANALEAENEFIGGFSGNGSGSGYGGNGTLTQSTGGVGTFNQSGGTNAVTGQFGQVGELILGPTTGSNGTYNLGGTGSLSAGTEQIGGPGDGNFNQTGGTNNAGGLSNFGLYISSESTYTLSGAGVLSVVGVEYTSSAGIGGFIQTGGTNTANGSSDYVGWPSLSINGLLGYQLSGNGALNVVGGETGEVIGSGAFGTFTQSGGTNNVVNGATGFNRSGFYLGTGGIFGATPNASGTGYYYLYAGSLSVSTSEYIGALSPAGSNHSGNGTFIQTSGSNTTTNLILSYRSGTGYYQLSGGTLSATATEEIADGGTASFVQTGGSNTTPSLYVASAGYGIYQLQGGSLVVTGNEYIGVPFGSDQPTAGQFFQTGGINNITSSGNLNILQGTYALSAGALTIPGQMNVTGYTASSFSQTGGVLKVTGPIVVYGGSTFSISGGSATAGSLNDYGALSIGIQNLSNFGQLHILGEITLPGSVYGANLQDEGVLNLQFDPTYTPQYGDTFPIIIGEPGNTLTGQFASITSNLPPSAGSFQIEYQPPDNPFGIDVVFVPEPTALTLLTLTSAAALLRRRQMRHRPTVSRLITFT